MQVWACWRVLSARPSDADEARAPHRLYGHLPRNADYSVGHWLREAAEILNGPERPIIVGGTGLYLTALTEGLAEIPPVPAAIRAEADRRMANVGHEGMLAELDAATASRIDGCNPARVQRAWEVLRATGRGLADWQAETGAPLLPLGACTALVLNAERDWLADRIDRRFEMMIDAGALDEVRAVLPDWSPTALWAKAIGAPELVRHLRGEMFAARGDHRRAGLQPPICQAPAQLVSRPDAGLALDRLPVTGRPRTADGLAGGTFSLGFPIRPA